MLPFSLRSCLLLDVINKLYLSHFHSLTSIVCVGVCCCVLLTWHMIHYKKNVRVIFHIFKSLPLKHFCIHLSCVTKTKISLTRSHYALNMRLSRLCQRDKQESCSVNASSFQERDFKRCQKYLFTNINLHACTVPPCKQASDSLSCQAYQ